MAAWQAGLADRGWNSLYWGNHDQPRSLSRFGDDGAHRVASAKTIATVLHLHRGTPYVYQGDELGMANTPFASIADFRDIQAINFHAEAAARGGSDLDGLIATMARMSRDQGRTPVQWDSSPQAGFTAGIPWIAVNPDHTTVNAATQIDDPDSVFGHYRRLINLRHDDPVVTDGDFELLLPDHPDIWAFVRRAPAAELLVAANFAAHPVTVDLSSPAAGAARRRCSAAFRSRRPRLAAPAIRLRCAPGSRWSGAARSPSPPGRLRTSCPPTWVFRHSRRADPAGHPEDKHIPRERKRSRLARARSADQVTAWRSSTLLAPTQPPFQPAQRADLSGSAAARSCSLRIAGRQVGLGRPWPLAYRRPYGRRQGSAR